VCQLAQNIPTDAGALYDKATALGGRNKRNIL